MPTIDRDGVHIHYERHGDASSGVPLLLSHGYGASSAMWDRNIEVIAARHAVITWDLRGHGSSDSPDDPAEYTQEATLGDMTALLDASGADRVVLGGHSLGGFLSLAFHLAHPERTVGLILYSTGPGYKQDAGRAEWNAMAEQMAAAIERRGVGALGGSPEVKGGRHDAGGLVRAARGILPQHDTHVIDALSRIEVPALVIVGEHDKRFLAAADHLAARLPDARKVVIPGAGHAANIDDPEAFNRAVTMFLRAAT